MSGGYRMTGFPIEWSVRGYPDPPGVKPMPPLTSLKSFWGKQSRAATLSIFNRLLFPLRSFRERLAGPKLAFPRLQLVGLLAAKPVPQRCASPLFNFACFTQESFQGLIALFVWKNKRP